MAQDAELLLKVGLDLSHFRRQLSTIGSQLAGQPLAVNVKFDRSKIVSEFRLLDRYIRGKKFYVEVNTNLKTEVDRAAKLTELLKNMPRGGGAARTPGVVEAGFSQAQLRKLKQDIKPLYKAAADAGLIAFDEAIAGNVANIAKELSTVGKSSVAGLLNGLASGDAQVRAAAQNLGQILIATIKATLGIASPSKETGKLGKFAAEGFEKGFVSSIVQSERRMARAIQLAVIGGIRNALSNLPGLGGALVSFERQLAASIQLAVRKAVREGMSAAIVPGVKGGLLGGTGGAATGMAVGGAKALGGGIAGGVAKLTAGGLMGTAANLARYSIDSSAYQEFVGKLYQEIINSALSSGSQGAIIGALAVGGVAGGVGFARGATGSLVIQAATAIRNRILAALLAVSTGDLNNIVKVMVRDVTGALLTNTIRQLRSASLGLPKVNWPAIAPASTIDIGPSSSGRLLSAGVDPRMLGAAAPPAGLLPSVSQRTARRSSIATSLEAIFAAGGPTFPEGPPGKLALTPEALKRRIDVILAEYLKVVEVEIRDIFATPALPAYAHDYKNLHWYLVQMLQPIVNSLETATRLAKEARIDRKVDLFFAQISSALRLRQEQMAAGMPRPGSRTLPAPQRIAGLLPPGIGRTPSTYATGGETQAELFARREREARMRSALRGMDVMGGGAGRPPSPYSQAYRSARPLSAIVPYAPGGAIVPTGGGGTGGDGGPYRAARTDLGPGYLAGGQLAKALKEVDPALRQARVPLAGAIEELGAEFGNAVKQVLLFGTAYKALAFVTALPGQALQASTALQTFRNQLLAVAGGATQADQAFTFVDSLAQRFNVPLQTAREGFIKLYASMQPAGFKPEQINNLFEGISKAAATFGLSADKVDRVNYAFAQMASKGQIMSEELKGQLGDVLPGALGLFAEAAQMTIPEFSKAMEDGAFTGKAMTQVLDNVATLLNTKFAGAAEGASKTLQGQLNAMQNALQTMYEAFEPIVNTLASNLFPILSQSIADAGSAVNALAATMAGSSGPANMLTGNARAIYEVFIQVKEIGSALFTIISNLWPTFEVLGRTVLSVLEQFARFINTPIGQFLSNVAIQTALVTSALQLMAKLGLMQAIAGLIQLITNTRGAIASLQILIATSKTAQLAIIGLGAGIVLAALSTLVGKLNEVYARMLDIQRGAQNAAQAIAAMSQTEATVAARRYQNQVAVLKKFQAETKGKGGLVTATAAEINAMAAAGATPGVAFTGPLVDKDKGIYGAGTIAPEMTESAIQRLSQLESAARFQARPVATAAPALQKIDFGAGASAGRAKGGADKAANEAKRLAEEIARQAQAAADALFNERQRLTIMQATNPTAKALAEYASQELIIQRELNQKLKEAKSEQERQDRIAEAGIQRQINALNLDQQLAEARKQAMQPLEDALRNQREQLLVEADIKRLVAEGMVPERAKEVAEIRKLTRAALEQIDVQIIMLDKQIEVAKAALLERQAREGSTKAVQDMIRALDELEKRRKKAEEDKGKASGAGAAAEAGVPQAKTKGAKDFIAEAAGEAQKNLEKLTNWGYQAAEGAKAIGSAFGQAFKDIASGSKTTQEALASMFESIASHFLDMAAQMITQMLVMYALKLILGLFGGGGGFSYSGANYSGAFGSGGPQFNPGAFAMPKLAAEGAYWTGGFKAFADGGVVTGPTLGLVGEGGEPEYIIPASKMSSAMARYSAGARGAAVIPSEGGEGISSVSMGAPTSAIDVRYTVERINSVDYVTADQFQRGMAQAAKQGAREGEQATLRRLQQSRSTRSRLGMV